MPNATFVFSSNVSRYAVMITVMLFFFLEEIGQIGISRVPQHQKRYEAVA